MNAGNLSAVDRARLASELRKMAEDSARWDPAALRVAAGELEALGSPGKPPRCLKCGSMDLGSTSLEEEMAEWGEAAEQIAANNYVVDGRIYRTCRACGFEADDGIPTIEQLLSTDDWGEQVNVAMVARWAAGMESGDETAK